MECSRIFYFSGPKIKKSLKDKKRILLAAIQVFFVTFSV